MQTGQGEFALAQANLRANVLAGRGPTFAYTGIAGTNPLPITLAHLDGLPASAAGDPASYTGRIWTNTTFTNALNPYNPNPGSFAGNLYTNQSLTGLPAGVQSRVFLNAVAVGYPINYWGVNSALSDVRVTTNSAERPYNSIVTLQVRRRLSEGLAASVSYTWQKNIGGNRLDYHEALLYVDQTSVPHAIQALWSYDIPVGRGKRYGANMNAWADGVVGGWTFSGTARFQTQSFFLRNTQLVGMSMAEAQKALSTVRFVTGQSRQREPGVRLPGGHLRQHAAGL